MKRGPGVARKKRSRAASKVRRTSASGRLFRAVPATPPPRRAPADARSFTAEQLRSAHVANDAQARDLIEAFETANDNSQAFSASDDTVVPLAEHDGVMVPQAMADLLAHVNDPKFKESWRVTCWIHTKYKRDVYSGAYLAATRELNAHRERLDMRIQNLEVPREEQWKTRSDDDTLSTLMDTANTFKRLTDHCHLKARNLENAASVSTLQTGDAPIATRVAELRQEILRFSRKSMQHEVTEFVAKILLAFFQNPFFPRNKFFSLLFVGAPGTGKTTIARDISRVLVASGLFEGGFADKGKSDFIGQYLGQTPHITKKTLTSYALEGILFIDEAYSLCSTDDKGRVDAYGAEFATSLVDFMTRFKGLSCIIAAGYEPEMRSQFLSANDGLPRRFPHRFLLNDLNEHQLTDILVSHNQSVLRPSGSADAESALTDGALEAFKSFVLRVRERKKELPHLFRVLENQAGSASNIAEFMSLLSEGRKNNRYFKAQQGVLSEDSVRSKIDSAGSAIDEALVIESIRGVLSQTEMSNRGKALRELKRLVG